MPRLFALSYFFFSLLVCSTSFAADDAPKEQQIKQAVISNNQNYLYQELIAIQKQFTALEVKLEQQNDSEKVKELESDLKKLGEDLIKLQELVSKNEQVKSSEIKDVEGRISDLNFNTNMWGVIFSLFGLVLGIAGIITGLSTIHRAKSEARDAADSHMSEWLNSNRQGLLSDARESLLSVIKELQPQLDDAVDSLNDLHRDYESKFSDVFTKIVSNKELTDSEKEQINNSSLSEKLSSLEQYLFKGLKAYTNKHWQVAKQHLYQASIVEYSNQSDKLLVLRAIFGLAAISNRIKKTDDEVDYLKQIITLFEVNDNKEIQLQVAKAMMNLGIIYGQEESPNEEIEIYKQLIEQFTGHDNEEIQLIVAQAMMNLGITHGQEKSPSEAIDTYKQLIEQFTGHDNEEIQLQVAKVMMNLGIIYGQEKLFNKAISISDELIQKFEDIDSADIQEIVKDALANLAELSILFEEPKNVILRIEKVELNNPDEQTSIVMKFMRFLLDNVTFNEVVNSIELLPSDIELTWQFSEIKDYINDNFTGLKRQQINAVVRFFEEHKDKEKFLEETKGLQE